MSADNFVGVKQIGNKWYVFDNLSASAEEQLIDLLLTPGLVPEYLTRAEALEAAHDLCKIGYYEYGVIEMSPILCPT